jgi:DNA-directed RNA polymerase specialized sigma24 family protein
MTSDEAASSALPLRQPVFATTHWSVVLTAGRRDTTRAQAALETLCRTYWYPLYAYIRRRGHSPEDAQDLTQEFFARLLGQNWVGRADRQRGRFRSFLLSVMNHFLAGEWDKARAKKRGGGIRPISLEIGGTETRYQLEPPDTVTAERVFSRAALSAMSEKSNFSSIIINR